MGSDRMNGFLKHWTVRLRATVGDPWALTLILLSGLLSLVYWPGLTDPSGAGWLGVGVAVPPVPIIGVTMLLLWIYLWSMLMGGTAGGRVAAGRRSRTFVARALPALPVGAWARALAEALVILTLVLLARAPWFFLGGWVHGALGAPGEFAGEAVYRAEFAQQSFFGALLILPFLLIWSAPARTIEAQKARPLLWVVLLFVALRLGLLETPLGCAGTSAVLTALSLFAITLEGSIPLPWKRAAGPAASRHRLFRHPELQFRRDAWLRPLPVAGALVAAEAFLIALDQWVLLSERTFGLINVLVGACLLSFVVMRPMGSKLAAAGVWGWGGCGALPGEFSETWSVLPVRRELVLRGVYLHGLISGAALWIGILLVGSLVRWLGTGEISLLGPEKGFLAELLFPLATVIPCLAVFLIAGAAGDRPRAVLSTGAFLVIVHLNIVLLVLETPTVVRLGTLAAIALIGGLPPLRHLRPAHPAYGSQ
jgi:hypothetical protein